MANVFWSLVWDDKEEFQAWANGPVCMKLFSKTNGKYKVSADDETGGDGDLTENHINRVLSHTVDEQETASNVCYYPICN